MTATRLIELTDAEALAALLRANREFLRPWDPVRSEAYYTVDGQRAVIRSALAQHEQGLLLPQVIVDGEQVVGRVTLNGIVRGAFQSCILGYWLGSEHNGRGLATRAVGEVKRMAFEELKLHRIEAGTLVHNTRSQRVLERNGFVRFGLAASYLKIAGQWQDHILFQVLADS